MATRIIVVGTSLGGLYALQTLLRELPGTFPVPVAIVQHRVVDPGNRLKVTLQRYSELRVREPFDKEAVLPGHVYLAPADYHLMLEDGHFALSTEGPVLNARPSVDVLFESAADAYGSAAVAVVLTGSSRDGAAGAARIRDTGGYVIVQDPATAESATMPLAAMAATQVSALLPLTEIGPFLVARFGREQE